MAGRLAGKIAVITGATSGMGLGTAKCFAKEGATLVFNARSADAAVQEGPTCNAPHECGRFNVSVAIAEHAAVRYAKRNIRGNVVAPGLTATPAIKAAFDKDKCSEMAARTQPMGRCIERDHRADHSGRRWLGGGLS